MTMLASCFGRFHVFFALAVPCIPGGALPVFDVRLRRTTGYGDGVLYYEQLRVRDFLNMDAKYLLQ